MFYYAKINNDGLCIGISSLKQRLDDEKMIEIPEYNEDYLWRKYKSGEWSTEKFEIEIEPSPSVDEKLADLEQLLQSQQMQNLVLMDINLTVYEELLTMKDQLALLTSATDNA